jgi:hypothetical protein
MPILILLLFSSSFGVKSAIIEEIKQVSETEFKTNEKEITIEQLKVLYEQIRGNEKEGKSKLGEKSGAYFLYIDWQFPWTHKLLKKLADNYHLPESIDGIALGYLDAGISVINEFLVKSIKHKLSFLWINYVALDKFESQNRLDLAEYIDAIAFAAPKAKDWLACNYSKLDSIILTKLIQAAHNLQDKIDLDDCLIKLEGDIEFGDYEYKLQKITMEDSFVTCKHHKRYCWISTTRVNNAEMKTSMQSWLENNWNASKSRSESLNKEHK